MVNYFCLRDFISSCPSEIEWLRVRYFQTFMLLYNDQERQFPGFTSDTSALFRIKDQLHFEDLWTKESTSSETQGQIVGSREILNGRKNMPRRKVKNGEKSPWGQCLTRPVPNGHRRSDFWLESRFVLPKSIFQLRLCNLVNFVEPLV